MEINVINGSVEYDGIPILTQVDFSVKEKEKIALVGRNGCGKTTLLKALVKEVEFIKGTGEEELGFYISGNPQIGFLRQTTFDGEKTMEAEILEAYSDLIELEKKTEEALLDLEKDSSDKKVKAYSFYHDEFERLGGYYYKKEYLTAIKKFGFTIEDTQKKLSCFSGGQRTKIALLKLLLSKPDFLILDEPTNHLDLVAIEWLEKYLSEYKKSLIIVSHDRMFLDKIVNIVYEIEYGETKRYKGNYTSFVNQKQQAYEKALRDFTLRKREMDRLQKVVDRFRYKANKAAMAQAKISQIKRMSEQLVNPLAANTKTFKSTFQPTTETVKETLTVDKLSFGYDKPLGEVSFLLERGDKLGIIGSNGCGKSTLAKTVMGRLAPLGGFARFGLHSEIGYFDQTQTQSSSPMSVLEDFQNEFPALSGTEARTALGAFLFSGEDVFKSVKDLSGGEKVRLALCKILKKRPNVLILDEPTNHLDITGKETLESMLINYKGTLMVISHDRYFINRICNKLLVFKNDKPQLFLYGYQEYEESLQREYQEETKEKAPVVKKGRPVSLEKERTRALHRIGVLEEKISRFEVEIAQLQNRLSKDPEVYTDYKKISEIEEQIKKLEEGMAPLVEEWENLVAKV